MELPEYEYVATQEIWHDGVRAYNVGDPVPADNVKAHGYDKAGMVAERDTKVTAQAIEEAREASGRTVPQPPAQGRASKT